MPSPPSSPAATSRRSIARSIIAWTLVVGAAVAGLAAAAIGGVATVYRVRSGVWLDGALYAMSYSALGIGLAVVLAVLAIIVGQGLAVRVTAVVLIVGVVVGTAVQGGSAALSSADLAAATHGGCLHSNSCA